MPLGILTDDQFESEITKQNGVFVNLPNKGRNGKVAVPESGRKLIGELAINGASTDELVREFGISASSISAYKNGATSTATYHQPNEDLKNHVMEARNKIVRRARKKLMQALDHITPDSMADCKARDLSGIAKDMSSIIRNMEPDDEKEKSTNNQFIFMVPPMKKEIDFPVIDVTD